jgi:hypothetical protein
MMVVFQGTWQFISTARLQDPDKTYEVSDELESLFFVMLYEGLHRVVNNKPARLNVEYTFDHMRVDRDGHRVGGDGKWLMYTSRTRVILEELEFEKSPPFTDLIRGLFRLFQSLIIADTYSVMDRELRSEDAANIEKLRDCKAVIDLMKNAVERKDWPKVCDKVSNGDHPFGEEMCRKDRAGLASLKQVIPPGDAPLPATPTPAAGVSRASKRGREEDDGPTTPAKRFRVKAV